MCSKVLNGHIILTDTSITTILAPEMTYTPEIQQRVEHLPHTLGRLPDIIHIHGAFIRATTFLHQSGIASFCQSYFFVVEVVYDDRFAFFRASVWQIVYTIREALLLGVI